MARPSISATRKQEKANPVNKSRAKVMIPSLQTKVVSGQYQETTRTQSREMNQERARNARPKPDRSPMPQQQVPPQYEEHQTKNPRQSACTPKQAAANIIDDAHPKFSHQQGAARNYHTVFDRHSFHGPGLARRSSPP